MIYQTFNVKPGLAHLVRYFWILEGNGPYTHFSLPSVCAELIFHFKGKFKELGESEGSTSSFTAGLHAQTLQPRHFNTRENFGIAGAYLYPHAIQILFGTPAKETTGQMIDMDTLAGSSGKRLEEALANTPNNKDRIALLETFIEHRARENDRLTLPVFKCIHLIIEKRGLVKVADLPSTACLSMRQFQRQFTSYAGFPPKLFSRIVRFQAATEFYGRSPAPLSEVAHACGYYDSAHFSGEFRELAGIQPKDYFSGQSGMTEWKDSTAFSR